MARSWKDLSPLQQKLVGVAGVVQVGLLFAAEADLARRPADQVRGSKLAWRAICLINFVGPIAYFVWGRRP